MSYEISEVHYKDNTKFRIAYYEDGRVTREWVFDTKEEADAFLIMKGTTFTEQ